MALKVTITGDLGEGKTTVAAIITEALAQRNFSVVVEDGYLTDDKECDATGNLLFHKIMDGLKKKPMDSFQPRAVRVEVKQSKPKKEPKPKTKSCDQETEPKDMDNVAGDEVIN